MSEPTPERLAELVEEAERGYDVSHLVEESTNRLRDFNPDLLIDHTLANHNRTRLAALDGKPGDYRVTYLASGSALVETKGFGGWRPYVTVPCESPAVRRQKLMLQIAEECAAQGVTNVDMRIVAVALDVLRPSWDQRTGRRIQDIAIPRLPEDQLGLGNPTVQLGAQDASEEAPTQGD